MLHLEAQAEEIIGFKEKSTEAILGNELVGFASGLGLDAEGSQSTEEFMRMMRGSTAELLDYADEQLAELTKAAQMLASTCHGPLTMRASKEDRTYTATLCTTTMEPTDVRATDHVQVLRTKK